MVNVFVLIILLLFGIFSVLYFWYTKDTNIVKISKNEVIEFKDSMALSGLPIIIFYQGEKAYNFLLDTGSNISYVSANSDLKVTPTGVKSNYMGSSGIDESCEEVITILYKNNIKYEHTLYTANLSAAFSELKKQSGILVSGILGNDFFKKYKYCLDFKELVAYRRK